jgi:hypothetical protein
MFGRGCSREEIHGQLAYLQGLMVKPTIRAIQDLQATDIINAAGKDYEYVKLTTVVRDQRTDGAEGLLHEDPAQGNNPDWAKASHPRQSLADRRLG